MLFLGIIGTNRISHQFVQGALESGKYTLSAVFSRKQETAENFANNYTGEIDCETDLNAFLALPNLDVIYIASPNSLHFFQAKSAICADKHVIVEKPAFSNPKEIAKIVSLTKEKKVFFFEAARHIHEENFKIIKSFLAK